MIPALSLQPIVENALHKGIRKKEGGGIIIIRTEERKEDFRITVADDGAGFEMKDLGKQGHIGIENVKKRLEVMCKGTLTIDSMPGKGTTVSMIIPKGENT